MDEKNPSKSNRRSSRSEKQVSVPIKKYKLIPEKHCRRCGSEQVVLIKKSIYARVYLYLLGRTRARNYFCKKCQWTW